MLLSVIIVSYNTRDLTRQAIQSLLADVAESNLLRTQTEVLVVDNNSSDGSAEFLQQQFPHITLIHNNDNVGFARANNQAIAQAHGEYVLLLNSDTVVQAGALEKMVACFESHPVHERTSLLTVHHGELDRVGIVAAQLLNKDGSIQAQGGSFPTLVSITTHMLLLDDLPLIGKFLPSTQHTGKRAVLDHGQSQQLIAKDWVGGTAMMVRRAVFAEVGTLDQNIFMYGEDVEFCLRAQAHHWDVALLPAAHITHLGSASSSSRNAILGELKGYLYIWSKHKPIWQLSFLRRILWTGCVLRVVLFGTMLQQPEKAAIYRQAAQVVLQA